jgi:hypothetical protein
LWLRDHVNGLGLAKTEIACLAGISQSTATTVSDSAWAREAAPLSTSDRMGQLQQTVFRVLENSPRGRSRASRALAVKQRGVAL